MSIYENASFGKFQQEYDDNNWSRFRNGICAAALFSLSLIFFGPSFLYFANISELSYLYVNIVAYIALACISVIALLSLMLVCLKGNLHKRAVALTLAIGFLFWLQGTVMVWNLGPLNGSTIDWHSYFLYAIFDSSVWLIVLLITFFKFRTVYRYCKNISLFLIIVQLGTLCVTSYFSPEVPEWKQYTINDENKFNYSSNKNIIILVLDSFQSDVFQEIIEEDNNIKNQFDGFTYYRNALSGFPWTYASVSMILTGEQYDNSVPVQNYIKSAFLKSSMTIPLKREGYRTEIYPYIMQSIYPDNAIGDNFLPQNTSVSKKDINQLFKLTLLRYLPQFAKPYVYTQIDSDASYKALSDEEFAAKILNEAQINTDIPVFKYIHIRGAHTPYNISDKLEYTELPQNRDGCKTQSKGSLLACVDLIDKLKQMSIYDSSMLIIIGDHGTSGGGNGIKYNGSLGAVNSVEYPDLMGCPISSAVPLVLVKPFGSRGELELSDAPVSLGDIPKTVIDELHLESDYPGYSILKLSPDTQRQRIFRHYDWTEEYWAWDKEYLPPMREYVIKGFSWLASSWQPAFKEYMPGKIKDMTPEKYQLGKPMDFSKDSQSGLQYQMYGWSEAEENITWTNARTASLIIPLSAINADVIMQIKLQPFLVLGIIDKQRMKITINGEVVGEFSLSVAGEQTVNLHIPRNLMEASILDITMEFPDAASPEQYGLSDDVRMLGIAVSSIILNKATTCEMGVPVSFGKSGDGDHYVGEGWSIAEDNVTWTDGSSATLVLPIDNSDRDINMEMKFIPYVAEGKMNRQKITILVNGNEIENWTFDKMGEIDKSIIIPASIIGNQVLNLEFKLPDAVSPFELGLSADKRKLGIALKSITLSNTVN